MKDAILTVLGILGILVGLPLLILWLCDKIFLRPMSKAQREEHSRRFRERLANPDFAALERHYDHALPDALKCLYSNSQELARSEFEVVPPNTTNSDDLWYVAFYEPLDGAALEHTFFNSTVHLGFADDGFGNSYIIDPRKPDPAVLFHDHEIGEMFKVADSLTDFLKWERREPKELGHRTRPCSVRR